jgi:hypothetical protein
MLTFSLFGHFVFILANLPINLRHLILLSLGVFLDKFYDRSEERIIESRMSR